MKHFVIDYTVQYEDGCEEECRLTLEANNLFDAYMDAQQRVQNRIDNGEVEDAVIWGICIVEDYVW